MSAAPFTHAEKKEIQKGVLLHGYNLMLIALTAFCAGVLIYHNPLQAVNIFFAATMICMCIYCCSHILLLSLCDYKSVCNKYKISSNIIKNFRYL